MHVNGFLHKTLSSVMHSKRLFTLSFLVEGLLCSKKLSVTELGRGMKTCITERSSIRKADRFIGNKEIHKKEVSLIYKNIALILIGNKKKPRIIVDWTHVPNTKFHVLRAALVSEGRALTLHEETHEEKNLGNRKIEKNFLLTLHRWMPPKTKPIVVTDAGFHNEWFKALQSLNWDYIGRVRGLKICYQKGLWRSCKEWMNEAIRVPIARGPIFLCKRNTLFTHCYLYKGESPLKKKYGKHKSKRGGRDKKNHRRSAMEPWMLVSSLKADPEKIIEIYKERMQIEEGFRDLKSPAYGFGMRHAHSRKRLRIVVLLLVAMLAALIARLIGRVMERQKLHYHFQCNSMKSRRVLSLFFIGCRAIAQKIKIKMRLCWNEINYIQKEILCDI